MASHIPVDLIDGILQRLPFKSLIRFQCVSRKFFRIIQSFKPARSSGDHRNLFLSLLSYLKAPTSVKLCVSGPRHECFVFDQPVPSSTYLVDSCLGLLVFYLGSNIVCVTNPSTRQRRMLPPFPFVAESLRRLTIGYDSITDDYKIVALCSMSVWIFVLKSSHWRSVRTPFPYYVASPCSLGDGSCFADGALHFLYRFKNSGPYEVEAFDLASETFSVVNDHPLQQHVRDELSLHCFGGCLSISVSNSSLVELYVRKRIEGARNRWHKLFSVKKDLLAGGKVIGYSHQGNRVLIFTNQGLFSYDLNEKSMQKTDIGKTALMNMQALDLLLCLGSIVSLVEKQSCLCPFS